MDIDANALDRDSLNNTMAATNASSGLLASATKNGHEQYRSRSNSKNSSVECNVSLTVSVIKQENASCWTWARGVSVVFVAALFVTIILLAIFGGEILATAVGSTLAAEVLLYGSAWSLTALVFWCIGAREVASRNRGLQELHAHIDRIEQQIKSLLNDMSQSKKMAYDSDLEDIKIVPQIP